MAEYGLIIAKWLTACVFVQPSSPPGNKRDRRTLDGDSSDDENEKDEAGDPHAKKSKHSEPADEAGTEPVKDETSAKQSRGRKKVNGDNQKNGIVKVIKEAKDEEEPSPKRKRGRPKGSGTKASAIAEASEDSASKARKQEGRKQLLDSTPTEKESSKKKFDGQEVTKMGSKREKVLSSSLLAYSIMSERLSNLNSRAPEKCIAKINVMCVYCGL